MSSPNPFEVLETEERPLAAEPERYGRMGRLRFCVYSAGLMLVQFLYFSVLARAQFPIAVFTVGAVGAVLLALQMLVAALRLQHIGYGRLWVWVLLVPPLNAVILLQCITAPKGYHQHSKYDTGGLIGLAVLLGCLMTLGGLLVVV